MFQDIFPRFVCMMLTCKILRASIIHPKGIPYTLMRQAKAQLWLLILLASLVFAHDDPIANTRVSETITVRSELTHSALSSSIFSSTLDSPSTASLSEPTAVEETTTSSTTVRLDDGMIASQNVSSKLKTGSTKYGDDDDFMGDEQSSSKPTLEITETNATAICTLETTSPSHALVDQSSDTAGTPLSSSELIEPPSTPILHRPGQEYDLSPLISSNASLFDDISFLESNRLIFEAVAHESSVSFSSNDSLGFMSFEEWKKLKQQPDNGSNISTSANVKLASKALTKAKLLQKRFNFALADCAATVVDTLGKGAGAILTENKDLYLLNECHADQQFVVIELCQEIYVETVVMGNYEFFSSQFKDVRILVLDVYPSPKWWILGEFTAENFRNVQQFSIESPKIWARYLKIEVLSHYGNEYYCPISVVRAHGKTMMEDAKEDTPLDNNKFFEAPIQAPQLDKCIVNPPYLGLSQFLQDINLTNTLQGYDLCEAEPIISTSLEGQQESVYKTIMKRLTLLESNATLSLLYIEEQLKLLLEAFVNLERRQALNFDALVALFNHTISTLLLNFRSNYAHLHQEYLKLLLMQKQTHEDIVRDTKTKLSFLSGELLFQERVSLFNLVIIICMLIYVVITRQAYVDDVKDRARLPNNHRQYRVKRPGRRRRRIHYVHS